MRALVFDGHLVLERSRPVPTPSKGDAIVRVLCAGICDTDIEITKGYMAFSGVLGHEFVGTVERSPDGRWDGKRVAGEINCSCGSCDWCEKGLRTHCPNRTVLGILGRDGAFADYLVLPASNLHEVPPEVSNHQAVFVEPLAAAFQILEQVSVTRNTRALVLGDGKLGLLAAQVLARAGAECWLRGRHPEKLRIAQSLGLSVSKDNRIAEKFFDLVVECTGTTEGLRHAMQFVRPRGTIVLKSTVAGADGPNLTPVVVDEVTVVGSRCGPFAPAIAALAEGTVRVEQMISHVYALDDGIRAMQHAAKPGALKIVLTMAEA